MPTLATHLRGPALIAHGITAVVFIAAAAVALGAASARADDPLPPERPTTPYSATMKKCITRTEGLGFRPESREMGPAAYMPPSER